jgi:hypothetical protein
MEHDLPEADTLAYTFSEAVAEQEGDAAQEYLIAFMDELFQLEPGLRQRFSDRLISELKEEVVRREDARFSHSVVTLIESIEADWGQES